MTLLQLLRDRPALRGFIAIQASQRLGSQMLNVAIGWYVYNATHNPMSLAYVGLAAFAPNACLSLIGGSTADRFPRGRIIALAVLLQTVTLAAFAAWSYLATPGVAPVYLMLLVTGIARAFSAPAMQSLLPRLVDAEDFPRVVAAATSVSQVCTLAGPAVGGLIYAVAGNAVFVVAATLYLLALTQARYLAVASEASAVLPVAGADKSVLAGVRYIRSNRLLLALITLDLFAVLLGGVTALLPIYAADILRVGPFGLGCLRCAPGVGAACIGVVLAHRQMGRNAGLRMLLCVAGFGVATVVFAVSKNFWLSLGALFLAGAFDMVSMVTRQTLLQLSTPDAMRGRVSAVNWIFIGASNELGEFESGLTAAWFGTVPSALIGGIGTLAVVGIWAGIFPELRRELGER